MAGGTVPFAFAPASQNNEYKFILSTSQSDRTVKRIGKRDNGGSCTRSMEPSMLRDLHMVDMTVSRPWLPLNSFAGCDCPVSMSATHTIDTRHERNNCLSASAAVVQSEQKSYNGTVPAIPIRGHDQGRASVHHLREDHGLRPPHNSVASSCVGVGACRFWLQCSRPS